MLRDGSLPLADLQREIDLGYFRPSLMRDLRWGRRIPEPLRPAFDSYNRRADRARGFVPHKAVYAAKKERARAVQEYLERIGAGSPGNA